MRYQENGRLHVQKATTNAMCAECHKPIYGAEYVNPDAPEPKPRYHGDCYRRKFSRAREDGG